MIVTSLEQAMADPRRNVKGPGWESRRLLLADARMGYSIHDTIIRSGTVLRLRYDSHLERAYCISGSGEIVEVGTGKTHRFGPGTLYALNLHDEHILRAPDGDVRFVCVFNPAMTGDETPWSGDGKNPDGET